LLAGESYRHIAARFDTSTGALQRHRADHLPASLTKSHAAVEVARADTLLDEVRSGGDRTERLYGHAELILERALESKDLKTALSAIGAAVNVMREGRAYLELRGEISGEMNAPDGPAGGIGPVEQLFVLNMPQSPEAAALATERLRKFPDALTRLPGFQGHPRYLLPQAARELREPSEEESETGEREPD
jgi:hypothetical protein